MDTYTFEFSNNLNNYIVTLSHPVYNVSDIRLVSGIVPCTQFTVPDTSNVLMVNSVPYQIESGNYTTGADLATAVQTALTGTDVNSVTYDSTSEALTFSNTAGSHDFTLSSNTTTGSDILGLPNLDVSSSSYAYTGGAINLHGPKYLFVRITNGEVPLVSETYTSNAEYIYTGSIMTFKQSGSNLVYYKSVDDPLNHDFKKGKETITKSLRVEWFYKTGIHEPLIPYDFRNSFHTLKVEIKGTRDKLIKLVKEDENSIYKKKELPEPVFIPELEYEKRTNVFIIYIIIGLVLITGITIMLSPRMWA